MFQRDARYGLRLCARARMSEDAGRCRQMDVRAHLHNNTRQRRLLGHGTVELGNLVHLAESLVDLQFAHLKSAADDPVRISSLSTRAGVRGCRCGWGGGGSGAVRAGAGMACGVMVTSLCW